MLCVCVSIYIQLWIRWNVCRIRVDVMLWMRGRKNNAKLSHWSFCWNSHLESVTKLLWNSNCKMRNAERKKVHSGEIHSVHESNLNIFSCFFFFWFYISKWWFRIWNSRLFSTTNQGWHFQFNSLHFIAFSKMQSNALAYTHRIQWPHTATYKHPWWSMIYWPDKIRKSAYVLSMEYKFKSIAFVPGVQFNFVLK